MKLTRVKLTGFKSFVDPVELRILPGLTGIVGPNGCGKSNLLEAIRWAMGEGAPKSLRGTAMDDVIFAGTATRPQRQFAEVAILAERDEDQIEVVRRIERGTGSAFRINGRDVRARDAQLIFADAATGAHSPALVSQGRIGAVIAARPTERRAMLEEAAGIAGLHVRRREAEIRLRATEANLARVGEVLADIEVRMGQLQRQARAAERYRSLSDTIRQAEARLIFARWRDAAAAAEQARAEADAADAAVQAANETQAAAATQVHDATAALDFRRSAARTAREQAADARHALAIAAAECATRDGRLAALAAQTERLERDRARERELAHDARAALTRLADERNALDVRIAHAEAARPGQCAALDTAQHAGRAAELALTQVLAAQATRDAERRLAEAAMASATAAVRRAADECGRIDGAIATLPDLAAAQAAAAETIAERDRAVNAAAAAAAMLDTAELARTATATALADAETDHAAGRAALATLESEARALAGDTLESGGALDRITAAPGYETALAAALADDLGAAIGAGSTAARCWSGADVAPSDPALPFGESLAVFVSAPPELARRLAQIAIVDNDDGTPLAVGQRAVTRDGRLRRWDGFLAEGTGAAAREPLMRRNRLAALEGFALPQAQTRLASARGALTAMQQARDAAMAAVATARRARDEADAEMRAALRRCDATAAEADRLAARRDDIAERSARAVAELTNARTEEADAAFALAALPASQAQSALNTLDCEATAVRDRVVALRNALATADAAGAAARTRAAAAFAEAEGWHARSGTAAERLAELAERWAQLDAERLALAAAPGASGEMLRQRQAALAEATAACALAVADEHSAEAAQRTCETAAAAAAEALANAREGRAGARARAENQDVRRIEMGRISGERFECPPALLPERASFATIDVGTTGDESARLERVTMARERIGPVNLVAQSELAEIEDGRAQAVAEHTELTEATHRLRGSIGSLNREGRDRLRIAFDAVDGHFRALFKTLFDGGEARLEMIDSTDPLDAGLEIMAQPPGKKLTALTLLSGGEQALTAVALIFALFLTNPAPLCVLDEVDAPLDDANVERFCDLLDTMVGRTATRYLIVTHNAVTMARMHRLYGVTMVEQGISRLVSVDLGGAVDLLAAA